jgi:hypothetical protein
MRATTRFQGGSGQPLSLGGGDHVIDEEGWSAWTALRGKMKAYFRRFRAYFEICGVVLIRGFDVRRWQDWEWDY